MSDMNAHTPMPYADMVASNVRAQAGRQRMSQAALSRATGISAGTLSRKWLGRYPFDVKELEAIAAALRVPLSSLLARLPHLDSNQEPAGNRPNERTA